MAGKKEHIGIVLHYDKPEDKKVIDVLNNLPEHETKCSFIRKAIISYGENYGKDFNSTDEKFDAIMEKLDMLLNGSGQKTEERKEVHPSVPTSGTKVSDSPETAPVKIQDADDTTLGEEEKEVSSEEDMDLDDFESYKKSLGDFLG